MTRDGVLQQMAASMPQDQAVSLAWCAFIAACNFG